MNSSALPRRRAIFFGLVFSWLFVLAACTHPPFKSPLDNPATSGFAAYPMQPCAERLGAQLDFVDAKVSEAVNASTWVGGYDLKRQYVLALQSSTVLRLYFKTGGDAAWTQTSINKILGLLSSEKSALTCVDDGKVRGDSILRIIRFESQTSSWQPTPFRFISSLSPSRQIEDRWIKLASAFGKILLLEEIDFKSDVMEEVQRSIIHEAMHLYGQKNLFSQEPQGLDNTTSGRMYLRHLESIDEEYRNSIKRELCLNSQLMRLVIENDANSKIRVLELLQKILAVYFQRDKMFGVGSIDAYWYMVEGVPQFLDQKFILKKNPQKVLRAYDVYCQYATGMHQGFYGNLAGSAIFHGLDHIYGESAAWKSTLNVDRDRAHLWILEIASLIQNGEPAVGLVD